MTAGAFLPSRLSVGNIIPDWNDLVYRDQWKDALSGFLQTTFPEFTGRICPAALRGFLRPGITRIR